MGDNVNDDDFVAVNRATWDSKVAAHLGAYRAEAFADDPNELSSVVRRDAGLMAPHLPGGSVDGLSLLHLQCHIGTDSMSWARLGADVTGLDFSGEAVAAARTLAERAGLDMSFVESPVERAAETTGRSFDVVYTSIGTITWLPDLISWARAIHDSLVPGGLFYIRDGHPMLFALDFERTDGQLLVTEPYFGGDEPVRFDDGIEYATKNTESEGRTTFEWPHPLSEVVSALLQAGLTIIDFQEYQDVPWKALPIMVQSGEDFVLPDNPRRVPLTFSIAARRGP